jgi:predicted anti-sigma-YlaC factor YlaD
VAAATVLWALPGCSIKRAAVGTLGGVLAGGNAAFDSHDDPDLVRDAAPFALTALESLIAEAPTDTGLLTEACRRFAHHAYAFVQQPADFLEAEDLEHATRMRARAKTLYLRGLSYGMRALAVDFAGISDRLRTDPTSALSRTTVKHVPLLYWTAVSWAAAFAIDKADSSLSIDQRTIEALMIRALQLDETWEHGMLHDFFIVWEGGRRSIGGSLDRTRAHFDRARELSGGQRVFPFVAYAEVVSVGTQNRAEFVQLLGAALAIDADAGPPEQRLANLVSQRRARWLLGRADDLFVELASRRTQPWQD